MAAPHPRGLSPLPRPRAHQHTGLNPVPQDPQATTRRTTGLAPRLVNRLGPECQRIIAHQSPGERNDRTSLMESLTESLSLLLKTHNDVLGRVFVLAALLVGRRRLIFVSRRFGSFLTWGPVVCLSLLSFCFRVLYPYCLLSSLFRLLSVVVVVVVVVVVILSLSACPPANMQTARSQKSQTPTSSNSSPKALPTTSKTKASPTTRTTPSNGSATPSWNISSAPTCTVLPASKTTT